MKTHAFKLVPKQDLKKSIEQFVIENKIQAGIVLTCVGSLQQVSLRMANQKSASTFDEKFEIISLVGTVSTEGCHLHLAAADETGKTTGGHLLAGCLVYTTAEIVIGELENTVFSR